jgi:hypothetical protein
LLWIGRAARRPITSRSLRAGIPVPGRFVVSIARSMTAPSATEVAVTMLFSKVEGSEVLGLQ